MSSSTIAVAITLVLSCTAGAVNAQKPVPAVEQQKKEKPPTPVTGELVSVDEDSKTFSVKTASEGELKFSYSEKTVITGAEKIFSGLAGAGSEVTVTYDSHGTAKVATRIEVKPKK
jgi:hypothetical protein